MIRQVIRIKKSEESSEQASILAMILAKNDYNAMIEQDDEDNHKGYLDIIYWQENQ